MPLKGLLHIASASNAALGESLGGALVQAVITRKGRRNACPMKRINAALSRIDEIGGLYSPFWDYWAVAMTFALSQKQTVVAVSLVDAAKGRLDLLDLLPHDKRVTRLLSRQFPDIATLPIWGLLQERPMTYPALAAEYGQIVPLGQMLQGLTSIDEKYSYNGPYAYDFIKQNALTERARIQATGNKEAIEFIKQQFPDAGSSAAPLRLLLTP